MGRVGIDPNLHIRNQAGHQVAQLGRDHQVVVALEDECRALDPGQPLQRAVVGDSPFDDRVVLRVAYGVAGSPGR